VTASVNPGWVELTSGAATRASGWSLARTA
jgi:hypothetical protein